MSRNGNTVASVAARRRRRQEGGMVLVQFKLTVLRQGQYHIYGLDSYVHSDGRALGLMDLYRKLSVELKNRPDNSLQRDLPRFAGIAARSDLDGVRPGPRDIVVRFSQDAPGWDWNRERWVP